MQKWDYIQMQGEGDDQELCFSSFNFEDDQKLGLIDISQEDDDLLMDSPFFNSLEDLRLSVTFDQPARPSYMRKSLAWDDAFFTDAGVLDNDELHIMNKGFETERQLPPVKCADVQTRGIEPDSSTKEDPVPSVSRKVNVHDPNRTTKSALDRSSLDIQRSLKKNKTELYKRGESHSSVKAPKESSRMINLFTGKSRSASVDAYQAKTENRTAAPLSVNNLKFRKKSATEDSCGLSAGNPSSPEFVSSHSNRMVGASSATFPSALLKRKTDFRKGGLSILASTKSNLRHSRFSTQSLSIPSSLSFMSPSSSSVGSCAGPERSVAKQQRYQVEVYSQRKSPSLCPRKKEARSPVERKTLSTPGPFSLPEESRKKLKPSYLRMPSPKIGFFDEGKSAMPKIHESLQFQFEMQRSPSGKHGPANKKIPCKQLPGAGTTPETKSSKCGLQNTQLQHSDHDIKSGDNRSNGKINSFSSEVCSTKTGADVGLRFRTGRFREVGEGICSKCRKTGSGELDRKRVGQISAFRQEDEKRVKGRLKGRLLSEAEVQKDETIIPMTLGKAVKIQKYNSKNLDSGVETANFEDQVKDLSRYFEVIDLTGEKLTTGHKNEKDHSDETYNYAKNTVSSFIGENGAQIQEQEVPRISINPTPSLSETESFSPGSRTPLKDKTPFSNRSGSFPQSTKEKLQDKSTRLAFSDKENSSPFGI